MENKKIDGIDKWEVEGAARTLKEAEEIKMKPKLYAAAQKELKKQLEATQKVLKKATIKNTF